MVAELVVVRYIDDVDDDNDGSGGDDDGGGGSGEVSCKQ